MYLSMNLSLGERQCCRVKKSEIVKCPGVIGWKANARPTGMDCVGKCPAIARGGGGGDGHSWN